MLHHGHWVGIGSCLAWPGAPWEEAWQMLVEGDCCSLLWGPRPSPTQGPGEQMCHVCLLGMKPVLREEEPWGREAARGDLVGVRWR